MQTKYRAYIERLLFPPETVAVLLPQADDGLEALGQRYLHSEDLERDSKAGRNRPGPKYDAVVLLSAGNMSRYLQKGIPDEIFRNSMTDLRYKQIGSFLQSLIDYSQISVSPGFTL